MRKPIPVMIMLVPPVIAAVIVGIAAGIISYGANLNSPPEITRQSMTIATGAGTLLGFLWGVMIWTQKLSELYQPKRLRGRNEYEMLTGNVLSATPKPIRIELVDTRNGALDVSWIDLPAGITVEQLVRVAQHVVSTDYVISHTLSNAHMPLSRAQFEALRDLLISKGLAKWNNPHSRNQGVSLLAPGRALFRQLSTYQAGILPRITQILSSVTNTQTQHTKGKQ